MHGHPAVHARLSSPKPAAVRRDNGDCETIGKPFGCAEAFEEKLTLQV